MSLRLMLLDCVEKKDMSHCQFQRSKPYAYIPLQRKTIRIGYWHWLGPPISHFYVTYNNKLVSFELGDANFSRHPMQNPNVTQWNIGCVGFQTFCVGHVHFMFFVLISFAIGGQCKPTFQWNMGFKI